MLEDKKSKIRPIENIARYFHFLSKDSSMGGKVLVPSDVSEWPEDWKLIEYKTYKKKLSSIPIIRSDKCHFDFGLLNAISSRKSMDNPDGVKIHPDLKILSTILNFSCGETKETNHRPYPSAGRRYPLEVYVFVNNVVDVVSGIYHFNLKENSLDMINTNEDPIRNLFFDRRDEDASCVFFITSISNRVFKKYGERGYRYILLEAGHMVQNMYLISGALGLACKSIGGFYDLRVERQILIDGEDEVVVYSFAIY